VTKMVILGKICIQLVMHQPHQIFHRSSKMASNRVEPFQLEVFFAKYEFVAKYLLCSSGKNAILEIFTTKISDFSLCSVSN